MLVDRGLDAAVRALAAVSPISVTVSVTLPERPKPPVESAAYFVVAEALANAGKHADAARVDVRIVARRGCALGRGSRRRRRRRRPRRAVACAGCADRVEALDGRLGCSAPPAARRRSRRAAVRVVIAEDLALLRDGLSGCCATTGSRSSRRSPTRRRCSRLSPASAPTSRSSTSACLPTSATRAYGRRSSSAAPRPETGILMVSQYVEPTYATELSSDGRGGIGYLLKDRIMDVADFLDAVQRVAQGGTALDPEVVAQLVSRGGDEDPLSELTPREREVLGLMAEGRSNAAIARRSCSPSARSRSTSRASSASSGLPSPTVTIAAYWRFSPTCRSGELGAPLGPARSCDHGGMRVSVIVPTYKRPESLRRCLQALARQQAEPDEILVVAHRDEQATHEVVQAAPQPVRLIPIVRPGVVAKMNAGLDAAAGDLIVLTDDDSEPRHDWLARIVATFDGDAQIAAVGGRDWLCIRGEPWQGREQSVVGTVDWLGRVTGNHHAGVGPARDVDVLKGVNLAVRRELLQRVRFDERLLGVGTQSHWELALCLTLRRKGYRIVYDPAIAVDHFPQPRIDDTRQLGPSELRDAVHNETLAVLEYLPPWRRPFHLAWVTLVGTGVTPGIAQLVRLAPKGPRAAWRSFSATQTGWLQGLGTFRASRRGHVPSQPGDDDGGRAAIGEAA